MSDVTHHTSDIYEAYAEQVDDPLDWETFKQILPAFNRKAMERIIFHGETLRMGYDLSTLSVIRIKRSFHNPNINWKKSNELKQELIDEGKDPDEHDWLVYYTDPWYARFYWRKSRCTIPNRTAYAFRPTGGDKGNRTKLSRMLQDEDDHRYTNFELVPHFDPSEKDKEEAKAA